MCPAALPRAEAGGTWVVDLDGVVWLAGEPIPGSADALDRLRDAGASVLFASNNSWPSVDRLLTQLADAGVRASREELVTSAQAAASMLDPGTRALVVGGDGLREALDARGVVPVLLADRGGAATDDPVEHAIDAASEARADAVVVGLARGFDFAVLAGAAHAVRLGARFIGTNEDATYPTPTGPIPGTGSILAALSTASGVTPEVAGKPYEPLARLIAARAERPVAVVGDRPSTDGALARRLGVPFALVLSGVTSPSDPAPDPAPDFVGADLAAVVAAALD